MKLAREFAIVLVTAPNLTTARALAKAALDARLIACANLVPGIESHYRWRGKRERSREVMLVCKSLKGKLPALERIILQNHPYDTPEFIVLPITSGTSGYLDWLAASVR